VTWLIRGPPCILRRCMLPRLSPWASLDRRRVTGAVAQRRRARPPDSGGAQAGGVSPPFTVCAHSWFEVWGGELRLLCCLLCSACFQCEKQNLRFVHEHKKNGDFWHNLRTLFFVRRCSEG
jgi:hypothetical protein